MNKAINLLEKFRGNHIDLLSINEAIAELEEAMKPKSCSNCEQSWEPNNQTFHKYFCEYLRRPVHGDFCCNRYKCIGRADETPTN